MGFMITILTKNTWSLRAEVIVIANFENAAKQVIVSDKFHSLQPMSLV
jgi:hypothetical protein